MFFPTDITTQTATDLSPADRLGPLTAPQRAIVTAASAALDAGGLVIVVERGW